MLRVNIVTIFPDFFSGPLGLSIPARAAAAGGVEYKVVALRDYWNELEGRCDAHPRWGT